MRMSKEHQEFAKYLAKEFKNTQDMDKFHNHDWVMKDNKWMLSAIANIWENSNFEPFHPNCHEHYQIRDRVFTLLKPKWLKK